MTVTESQLSAGIKSGNIFPAYFLYGKEPFLTRTYAGRLKDLIAGKDPSDFNCLSMKETPEPGAVSDFISCMPIFADRKLLMIHDFDPDKLKDKELKEYLLLLENIPDTSVIVFYVTGFELQVKKAAVKKILDAVAKIGCVCELKPLTLAKTAALISKKAVRNKRLISTSAAAYLAEATMCDLTLASAETDKLCAYVEEGEEITREIIDRLVVKHTDAKVYELADAITKGNRLKALETVDELFRQRMDVTPMIASLGGAFIDFYRAKLGKLSGKTPSMTASDFGYKKNREWVVSRNYTAVDKVSLARLKKCIGIISKADIKLKSASVNERAFLEQIIVRLTENDTF